MKNSVGTKKGKQTDLLLTLAAVFVLPVYYYGIRVLIMLATALATALIIDFLVHKVFRNNRIGAHFRPDSSSAVTAAICVLLMSAAAPYWVAAVAVAFGLLVAKYPFGARGRSIFNPAAAGLVFTGLCWPDHVFKYPEPATYLQLTGIKSENLVESIDNQIRLGGIPSLKAVDIILGRFVGPVGATAGIVLVACGLYLLVRRRISLMVPASVLLTVSTMSLAMHRIPAGPESVVILELISGVLLFGCVFMAGDPETIPKTKLGQIYYGIFLGLFTMVFKIYGINDFSFLHALLIVSVMSGFCDKLGQKTIAAINRQFPIQQEDTIKRIQSEGENS